MTFDTTTPGDLEAVGGYKWSQGEGVLGAFVAEMDFGLAPAIKDTLTDMVTRNRSGYVSPHWVADLQQATAKFLERRYGWKVKPENILDSPDVLTGMILTMKRHIKPEARVIVPTPAYMPFMFLPNYAGHELVQVPMIRTETSWELDYDAIDAAFQDGDLFVLCNPHNPIGKVYTREEMLRLSEIVEKYNGRVFNDEIHAPLTMPGVQHIPYPTVSEAANAHSLTAMSASKAWNLAGYKCAQIVVNDADLEGVTEHAWDLHGAATPGVLANIAAFNESEEWLTQVQEYLAGNQARLVELLAEELHEAVFIPNEGTYLAWIDCSQLPIEGSPRDFFFEKAKVALTDGGACGDIGSDSVRLNFGTPRPILEEIIRRMGKAVRSQ